MSWKSLATGTATLLALFAWSAAAEAARHGGGGGHHSGGFHHAGFRGGGFHHSGFHSGGFHHSGFRSGGFHHGFHHHGFHHHGFHHHGFHRNFFFSSFYRPFFYGSYWPYYNDYGYYRPYYSYYSPYYYPYRSYYTPSYYYSTPNYLDYCPPDYGTDEGSYIDPVMSAIPSVIRRPAARQAIPYSEDGNDSSYRYDGDPVNVAPSPVTTPHDQIEPRPAKVVPDARYVSQPAKSKKYTYRAYGEKPAQPAKESGTILVNKPKW